MNGPSWKPRLGRARTPLYGAIVEALAADIGAGRLAVGARLPTQRELAGRMGASLATITRAYAEAERRGLIRSQVGNGSFVRDLAEPDRYTPALDRERIDLGPTAVPLVPGDLGHMALAAALAELSSRADLIALSGYQAHGGAPSQRSAGARWLQLHGVTAGPDEVTLCGGAQHASVIALATLAKASGVLVEALTYPGALAAAHWLGLPTHPVALDEEGLLPAALAEACRRSGAKVLYCTPTHHSPTTAVMSRRRRQAIVAVCRKHDVAIIENAALAPLVPAAPPPLAALAPERTFHISSLSKAVLPALRIGFLRTPASARAAVERAAAATEWSASPLLAEIATRWIDDGTAATIRDARRGEAAARQAIAAKLLRGHRYQAHATAYFLWMPIAPERSAAALIAKAEAEHVLLGPAELFAARAGSAPNAIRVSLGAARSRADLQRGLGVLARLFDEPAPAPRRMV